LVVLDDFVLAIVVICPIIIIIIITTIYRVIVCILQKNIGTVVFKVVTALFSEMTQ